MDKHTPGPWVADFHTEKVYSADNVVVYELGTNEADGYLISAAPDLLEALENMLSAFDNPILRRKLASDFNAQAIAAIARARGEA